MLLMIAFDGAALDQGENIRIRAMDSMPQQTDQL